MKNPKRGKSSFFSFSFERRVFNISILFKTL